MTESFYGLGHVHPGGNSEPEILPIEGQVEQPIDPKIKSVLAKGASSFIDDRVISAFDRLQNSNPGVLAMIANPGATLKMFQAHLAESNANASARKAIANAVKDTAIWAGQEVQREVIFSYVTDLKESLGSMLPEFCAQHGIALPRPNSIDEMFQLIRLNSAVLGVLKYRQKLDEQMERIQAEDTQFVGDMALSEKRRQRLPGLYASQRESLPLVEKVVYQNVAHQTALFGGALGASIVGTIAGFFRGVAVAINPEIRWGQNKADQLKRGIQTRITSLRGY